MSVEWAKLIGYVEADLNNAKARLTELRAHLAAAGITPTVLPVCTHGCGELRLPPGCSMADHLWQSHGIVVEPPCGDPRPDPRTHPEYWTE